MSTMTVRIEGFDEAQRKVLRLTDVMQGRLLLAAVQDGADYARDLAEALAPRQSGGGKRGYHGADHIGTEVHKNTPTRAEVAVGAEKSAYWLNIQEWGTLHMPSQPWLMPTFDSGRTAIEQLIAARVRSGVRRVAAGG